MPKSKPKVYFRADGNSSMGLGHVIRSLALAEMLVDHFDCYFIIQDPLDTLVDQIEDICKATIKLDKTEDYISEAKYIADEILHSKDIIVLDGYHFRTEYQKIVKSTGAKLVCIDDINDYHFVADVIINHAGGINSSEYSAEPYTQFLLGLDYALLRAPFREAARNRSDKEKGDNNNLFLCLGGADPNNDLLNVLRKCEAGSIYDKYYVVVGGAFLFLEELRDYLSGSRLNIVLLKNLSSGDMVEYMRKCSTAITSPSTISYEYLSVGGTLYLYQIANNQISIEKYFREEGLAFSFDRFNMVSDLERVRALDKQELIFDGFTKNRFLQIL